MLNLFKKRLDLLVIELLPAVSRTQIVNLIEQGHVTVNGQIVTKPGISINIDAQINCDFQVPKYVSRAGFKLEQALISFKIDVSNKIILDAGLSTGGFTDCLLQHGAAKIYGVDVGTSQVHLKIKNDARVCVMEQTNLRYLESLPDLVDVITLDLSFISILKVISNVYKLLKPGGELITLIKPQFEVGKELVSSGGIVKDEQARNHAIQNVITEIQMAGFSFNGLIDSPIKGGDGNSEYLAYFIKL